MHFSRINRKKLDYLRSPNSIDSEEYENARKIFKIFRRGPAYRALFWLRNASGEVLWLQDRLSLSLSILVPSPFTPRLSCSTSRRQRQKLEIYIYIYIYLQSRCTGTALIFSARSLRGCRSWIRFECIRERVQSAWEYVGEKRMDARAWRVERISFLSVGRVRAKSGETRRNGGVAQETRGFRSIFSRVLPRSLD